MKLIIAVGFLAVASALPMAQSLRPLHNSKEGEALHGLGFDAFKVIDTIPTAQIMEPAMIVDITPTRTEVAPTRKSETKHLKEDYENLEIPSLVPPEAEAIKFVEVPLDKTVEDEITNKAANEAKVNVINPIRTDPITSIDKHAKKSKATLINVVDSADYVVPFKLDHEVEEEPTVNVVSILESNNNAEQSNKDTAGDIVSESANNIAPFSKISSGDGEGSDANIVKTVDEVVNKIGLNTKVHTVYDVKSVKKLFPFARTNKPVEETNVHFIETGGNIDYLAKVNTTAKDMTINTIKFVESNDTIIPVVYANHKRTPIISESFVESANNVAPFTTENKLTNEEIKVTTVNIAGYNDTPVLFVGKNKVAQKALSVNNNNEAQPIRTAAPFVEHRKATKEETTVKLVSTVESAKANKVTNERSTKTAANAVASVQNGASFATVKVASEVTTDNTINVLKSVEIPLAKLFGGSKKVIPGDDVNALPLAKINNEGPFNKPTVPTKLPKSAINAEPQITHEAARNDFSVPQVDTVKFIETANDEDVASTGLSVMIPDDRNIVKVLESNLDFLPKQTVEIYAGGRGGKKLQTGPSPVSIVGEADNTLATFQQSSTPKVIIVDSAPGYVYYPSKRFPNPWVR